jgi:hypothetical protein
MGTNHTWIEGNEDDALAGRIITTMVVGEMRFIATSVPQSSLQSEQIYDVIEMPGGLSYYVCISEEEIKNLTAGIEDAYQVGFTFGIFVSNILTNVYYELMLNTDE